MLDADSSLLCSNLCRHNVDNPNEWLTFWSESAESVGRKESRKRDTRHSDRSTAARVEWIQMRQMHDQRFFFPNNFFQIETSEWHTATDIAPFQKWRHVTWFREVEDQHQNPGWGVFPYMGYIGTSRGIGYGFWGSRSLNRVSFLTLLFLCP